MQIGIPCFVYAFAPDEKPERNETMAVYGYGSFGQLRKSTVIQSKVTGRLLHSARSSP